MFIILRNKKVRVTLNFIAKNKKFIQKIKKRSKLIFSLRNFSLSRKLLREFKVVKFNVGNRRTIYKL